MIHSIYYIIKQKFQSLSQIENIFFVL